MPKPPHVNLIKQVKVNSKWRPATVLFDRKGRVRADHVRVNGQDEAHPEGSYFIEWWDNGKRRREAAGAIAQDAADEARVREAELTAARYGVIPPAPAIEAPPPDAFTLSVAPYAHCCALAVNARGVLDAAQAWPALKGTDRPGWL